MQQPTPPWWRRTYDRLFVVIARPRLQAGDLDLGVMHSHLIVVLATSAVMWAYALVSLACMASPWPALVGIVTSAVHLLSPLLFRWSNNTLLVCSVMLAAGMAHQTVFVCFNGGYLSGILTWYAFLPSLAGVIVGRRGALLWLAITVVGGLVFLLLHLNDVVLPQALSPLGGILAQALLVFGWILLAVISVLVHIAASEWRREESERQRNRFEDLFRALFHDLAAPISTIELSVSSARQDDPRQRDEALQAIGQAAATMRSITGGARLLYSLDKGLVVADPAMARLDAAVHGVTSSLLRHAQAKSVRFAVSITALQGRWVAGDEQVLTHHVLGNILANAIKFSPLGGTIHIDGTVADGTASIVVTDQGAGMSTDVLHSLAASGTPQVRPGTAGEPGSGFGLQLARAFLRRFAGDMLIQSPAGTGDLVGGTRITVHLPLITPPGSAAAPPR